MGHSYHNSIKYMKELGIVQLLSKKIPQLTITCPFYMVAKAIQLIFQPIFSTEYFSIGTSIQAGLIFFNDTPIIVFTLAFNVIDSTSS